MDAVEHDHNAEHQRRVENIQERFVSKGKSVIAYRIFDDAKEGSNQNNGASCVQDMQVALPCHRYCGVETGSFYTTMEDDGSYDEESKETDLYGKTDNDNILADGESLLRSSGKNSSSYPQIILADSLALATTALCKSRTSTLNQERQHIARDENFGEPFHSDHGVRLSI